MVTFAKMVAPEPIEAPFLTRVVSTFQSFSVCRPPPGAVARGISVVDKGHIVPDENVVFDSHAFADESMTGDLAPRAYSGVLLNLNERSELALIPNLAPVKVYELRKFDILAELDVRGYASEVVHAYTASPLRFKDSSAASSIRTIRKPAKPSLMGGSPVWMQSTK